jgi:hypothetical protein
MDTLENPRLFEFDVVGRARGLLTQTHVHTRQTGRHEVIEGRDHLLGPGVNRLGFPRPVAAARLVRDFGAMSYAAQPPLPIQRVLSRAILAATARAPG